MFLSFIKLLFKSKQESWNFGLGTILNQITRIYKRFFFGYQIKLISVGYDGILTRALIVFSQLKDIPTHTNHLNPKVPGEFTLPLHIIAI